MKVLVIENSSAICARLLALLSEDGRYEGKGCVSNSADALEKIQACQPDALLMSLRLADGSGFNLLKSLQSAQHTLPVIVLSERDEWQYRAHAQDLGAAAVLNIASQFEAILPTLDRLLATNDKAGSHPALPATRTGNREASKHGHCDLERPIHESDALTRETPRKNGQENQHAVLGDKP